MRLIVNPDRESKRYDDAGWAATRCPPAHSKIQRTLRAAAQCCGVSAFHDFYRSNLTTCRGPSKRRRLNEVCMLASDCCIESSLNAYLKSPYAELELDDLRGEENSSGILLEMKDRDRYFNGRPGGAQQTVDVRISAIP